MFRASNVIFRLLWKVNGPVSGGKRKGKKRFSVISKHLALQYIATGYQRTKLKDVMSKT